MKVLLRRVNGFLPLGNVQLRVGNDILRVGLVLMWGGNVLMHLGLVQIRLGLVQIRLGNDLTRRINSFLIMLNHLPQSKSCSRPATGRLRGGKDDSGWARHSVRAAAGQISRSTDGGLPAPSGLPVEKFDLLKLCRGFGTRARRADARL